MNNRYNGRSDFYIQPTDGLYSRGTQQALIYAIQYEEGLSDSVADGNFGPTTKANLPTLQVGSQDGTTQFVHLLQAALIFNNFNVDFDGIFGNGTKEKVIAFQEFSGLPGDGGVGPQTWSSLLVSTGDPSRKGTALDCVTEITPARAQTLVNAGYQIVGRYLTNVPGTSLNKRIRVGELETIFNAGLSVFPIYQTYGGSASYFNSSQGELDAFAAYNAAKGYGFEDNTIIYFAVDYDSTDDEISSNILPHFQAVHSTMESLGSYRIGIYGTRNACSRVSKAGFAVTSFVSDMSTGFSGNLGFPLPENWAFDQISTITLGSGEGRIEIDNNIKSGKDNGVNKIFDTDEIRIQRALKNSTRGINPFDELFNVSMESDGKDHTLIENLYFKVSYSVNGEGNLGKANPVNTIIVSDKKPKYSVSLLNAINSNSTISNELEIDPTNVINKFSTNIENGFISTYVGFSLLGEVEYVYEITVGNIELIDGSMVSAKIAFKVTLKNKNLPNNPPSIPVEAVDPEYENAESPIAGVFPYVAMVAVGSVVLYFGGPLIAEKAGAAAAITRLLQAAIAF